MLSVVGRPKSAHPKDVQIKIRADDETVEMLNYCCEKTGMNKSDIIRLGIEKVRQSIDEGNKTE